VNLIYLFISQTVCGTFFTTVDSKPLAAAMNIIFTHYTNTIIKSDQVIHCRLAQGCWGSKFEIKAKINQSIPS
jgi:hypothetical protein